MKKVLCIILLFTIFISMAACNSNNPDSEKLNSQKTSDLSKTEEIIFETIDSDNNQYESSKKETPVLNTDITIEPTVLFEDSVITILANKINYTEENVEIELVIDNHTDEDLYFSQYFLNSINGYTFESSQYGSPSEEVLAGQKCNYSIRYSYEDLIFHGIYEIADIEIGFKYTKDSVKEYIEPIQLKTSAFETYDYQTNHFREAMRYTDGLEYYSEKNTWNYDGLKLISISTIKRLDENDFIVLEFENTTDDFLWVSLRDLTINNLNPALLFVDGTVAPSHHLFIHIDVADKFTSPYIDVFGINEIGSFSFSLCKGEINESNSYSAHTVGSKSMNVNIPNKQNDFDHSGKIVYNKDGVIIKAKKVIEVADSLCYQIILFVENNSDKDIRMATGSDNLMVNNINTENNFYLADTKIGECGEIVYSISTSELNENNINSVSDIDQIEFNLEIYNYGTLLDEATISFNNPN